MAEGLQTELPRIWSPVGKSLCLRLQHQVVAALQRAGHIAAKGDLRSGQLVLRGMVNIHAGNIEGLCGGKVVDGWLHSVRIPPPFKIKVLRDELPRLLILVHQCRLPGQKIRHQPALETGELRPETAVNGAHHRREVLPAVDPVAPVVQPETAVDLFQCSEFLPHIFDEQQLYIVSGRLVMLGFIVCLVADHRRMLADPADQLADDPLRMEQIGGTGNIHYLTRAVFTRSLGRYGQDTRVLLHQPRGYGIGRCSDDHRDPRRMHRVQHPVNRGEVEHAVLRLMGTPGGFSNADCVDARRLHHGNIFIEPLARHIFVVIGHAVAKLIHYCSFPPSWMH
ncbi:hypothetical protein D3C73_888210 [compost metagenome]